MTASRNRPVKSVGRNRKHDSDGMVRWRKEVAALSFAMRKYNSMLTLVHHVTLSKKLPTIVEPYIVANLSSITHGEFVFLLRDFVDGVCMWKTRQSYVRNMNARRNAFFHLMNLLCEKPKLLSWRFNGSAVLVDGLRKKLQELQRVETGSRKLIVIEMCDIWEKMFSQKCVEVAAWKC